MGKEGRRVSFRFVSYLEESERKLIIHRSRAEVAERERESECLMGFGMRERETERLRCCWRSRSRSREVEEVALRAQLKSYAVYSLYTIRIRFGPVHCNSVITIMIMDRGVWIGFQQNQILQQPKLMLNESMAPTILP